MKHLNLTVYGKVQDIGFRYAVKEMADQSRIYGYVRNLRDGNVSIEAEGEDMKIDTEQAKVWGYRDFKVY